MSGRPSSGDGQTDSRRPGNLPEGCRVSDDEYISGKAAQQRLHRSERQVRNYAAAGRIRSRRAAGRVGYHAGDIDRLAGELLTEGDQAETQIMPPGPLLERIRELERQLVEAAGQVGYLRGLLEETTKDRDQARRQLVDTQASGRRPWLVAGVAILLVALLAGAVVALILIR